MQKKFTCLFLIFSLFCFSCSQTSTNNVPVETSVDVFKDQNSFLKYYNGLKLWEDFIALDTSSNIIDKGDFLMKVSSGDYYPLRHTSNDSVFYKLYKMNVSSDDMIYIKALAGKEYTHYQMEGKILPEFSYTDLEGKIYDKETTKGKIVVLKFWFISCVPCVKEMPALNKLVDNYKDRKDIVFVSLAFDSKEELKEFLAKKKFDYAVVANQKDYAMNELGISSFPTHIVINKKGEVVKVVNKYEEMESVLNKEALQ